MIDITPTVLDFSGSCSRDIRWRRPNSTTGSEFKKSLRTSRSPAPRDTQFWEREATRSIYHKGWKAVAFHKHGTPFEDDHWELYNQNEDFTEYSNLADTHPKKLLELQALWWKEAEKNNALPILEAQGGRVNSYNQILIENGLK